MTMTALSLVLLLATPLNAALISPHFVVARGPRNASPQMVQRTKGGVDVKSAARDLRKYLRLDRSEPDRTAPSASSLAATFAAAAAAADFAATPFSEAAEPSESAAAAVTAITPAQLVQSFVAATERGDAAAATKLCTEDFLYKTHSTTTESLAAAGERLHTKCPVPAKVTKELHEERPGVLVREIVAKPVPFITVAVRQEFEVRGTGDGDVLLCRAEYIKQ